MDGFGQVQELKLDQPRKETLVIGVTLGDITKLSLTIVKQLKETTSHAFLFLITFIMMDSNG
jgi:hypothetical protein